MATESISDSDEQAAEIYTAAHQRENAIKNLLTLMDDISNEAAARGLTPELLEELLHDESGFTKFDEIHERVHQIGLANGLTFEILEELLADE